MVAPGIRWASRSAAPEARCSTLYAPRPAPHVDVALRAMDPAFDLCGPAPRCWRHRPRRRLPAVVEVVVAVWVVAECSPPPLRWAPEPGGSVGCSPPASSRSGPARRRFAHVQSSSADPILEHEASHARSACRRGQSGGRCSRGRCRTRRDPSHPESAGEPARRRVLARGASSWSPCTGRTACTQGRPLSGAHRAISHRWKVVSCTFTYSSLGGSSIAMVMAAGQNSYLASTISSQVG